MDILQAESVFTKEDKQFNRNMIQRAKHDANRDNSVSSAKNSLSSADKYFGCVDDILNDYRKRWEIV